MIHWLWRIIFQVFILPAYICRKLWRRVQAKTLKYEMEGMDLHYIVPEKVFTKMYT